MGNYILMAETILVGAELSALKNGAIVVKDKQIEYVEDKADVTSNPLYSGYEMIDLGNVVLMPGMIDCHNHTSLDARLNGHLEMMNDPECELTIRAIKNMRDDLFSGVTSTRCLGEKYYIDVALRSAINVGRLEGPRLQVSGIGMRSIHGHGFVGVPHTGEQEFRKTCRENMLRKVDLLKVFVTAGAPPLNGNFIPSFLSLEEIETVTSEAKRMGIRTAAHCIGGEGLINCVKAGVDVIDHAYCATDSDLELIAENNRFVCLTASVFMDTERNKLNPPEVAYATDKGRERVIKSMEKIVKSGVKYALGTDAMHGALYKEAIFATHLGASSYDALLGVTINAARLCAIDNITGSLESGKYADIIAVKENPIENLKTLRDVMFVMKEGEIYKA